MKTNLEIKDHIVVPTATAAASSTQITTAGPGDPPAVTNAGADQVTVVTGATVGEQRVDPPLTPDDLPLRLAFPITAVANATGMTLESAALLVLSHLATWCGERSGCYMLDGGWARAAVSQLVVFPDAAAMAQAQPLLTDEFTRLEDALRGCITQFWDQVYEPDRVLASRIDPTGKTRRQLQRETLGWITWLQNPEVTSFRQGTRNAFRQALSVFLDDPKIFEDMLAPEAPPQSARLLQDLQRALTCGHVFQTRAEAARERDTGKYSFGCIKTSLLGHVDVQLGERLVRSHAWFVTSWLRQAFVWAPEYDPAPGRFVEPSRQRWNAEWVLVHRLATHARMYASGTQYLTPVAAEVMMGWQLEARALRAQLPEPERAFVHWAEQIPYRLLVPLMVTANHSYDSAGGLARLALRLARYGIRNALQFYRRTLLADAMINDPRLTEYVRELVARGYQHWPSLASNERDAFAVACFATISRAWYGAPGFPRSVPQDRRR